jgi:hypothetical protein
MIRVLMYGLAACAGLYAAVAVSGEQHGGCCRRYTWPLYYIDECLMPRCAS